MTPRQIRLLQRSFALIQPIADRVGGSFYERLFERHPEVRPMFRNDIELQQRKLMNFFGEFVRLHLRSLLTLPVTACDPEVAIPGIAGLAQRHLRYGVQLEHFSAAKEALFWSFQRHLADEFDEEVIIAWSTAYDMIAKSMIRVMQAQATPPVMPERRTAPASETDYSSIEDVLFR
jgi:hemoglobin-like flavoprotein